MIRTACLRALALVPLATLPLCGTPARAGQSEPASRPEQSDPKPTDPMPAPQTNTAGKKTVASEGQGPANLIQKTPAQLKYGLPRNPQVGERADLDLTKPLTLDRAVMIGLERQNSIAISRNQTDSASARLIQARASYFPQIAPRAQYQTQMQPGGAIVIGGQIFPGSRSSEIRNEGLNISQMIFDTGKREANVGSARRNLFASEYGLADQRQSVILLVTEDYYNLKRSRELVKVQQENVLRATTNLEVIRAQVAVGTAAKSDTLQAEADLANAQVALLQAQNDYNTGQASLKNSMGIVTSAPLLLTEEVLPAPDPSMDTTTVEDYAKVAYTNRNDVKRQQELVNASGYSVKLAHINNGVTVDASVNEGYQLNPNAGESRSFTVTFSYPLFDGGSTRAAVRDSKAQLETSRRTLDQLQQQVRLNVEQSYLVRELSRQRVVASQAAVRASQLNYEAALERQKNGLINILDVITAQVQLVTANVSLVNGIYDFYIADARLKRNIGLNDPNYVARVPGARAVRTLMLNTEKRSKVASNTTGTSSQETLPADQPAGAGGGKQ